MNVVYACRNCEHFNRTELTSGIQSLRCETCGHESHFASEAVSDGRISSCLVCGCPELYVRKDFSQRLGVTIVVVGLASYLVAIALHLRYVGWGILFATALIDLILYLRMKSMLQCYRCQASYRGLAALEAFEPFDLETYEKFRQEAIRKAQARRLNP